MNRAALVALSAVILSVGLGLAGCSSTQKAARSSTAQVENQPEVVGPIPSPTPQPDFGPMPSDGQTLGEQKSYGPAPENGGSVVLVLGPGLARGLAHAGVLRALSDAKIQVGAIVASEMGAWMGALYGVASSINEFEWRIQKLKAKTVLKERSFFSLGDSGPVGDAEQIGSFLDSEFQGKEIKDSRIPLYVAVQDSSGRNARLLGDGQIKQVLRWAITVPGFLDSESFSATDTGSDDLAGIESALTEKPFPVEEARAMRLGPVIVVDAMGIAHGSASEKRIGGRGSRPQARDEAQLAELYRLSHRGAEAALARADLVIRPDLRGIGILDFDKKSEIIFRGKSAMNRSMDKLRALLGGSQLEGVNP